MDNCEILQTAIRQSAVDLGCQPEDFLRPEHLVVASSAAEGARKYLTLPFGCQLVSYGSNIVASAHPSLTDWLPSYLSHSTLEHCFEPPATALLAEKLKPLGYRPGYQSEYFLPDVNRLKALSCSYELRVLEQDDLAEFYLPQWSNALCEARKELDVLGVGAFDHGKLIGLAGCSADCAQMWQIGVDVLPEYRRQGIAAALTSRLAQEILLRDKVPIYCAVWSNLKSVRNALKCGFLPAWVELSSLPVSKPRDESL